MLRQTIDITALGSTHNSVSALVNPAQKTPELHESGRRQVVNVIVSSVPPSGVSQLRGIVTRGNNNGRVRGRVIISD